MACPACTHVLFFAAGEPLEPYAGVAALFGDFVLVDTLSGAGIGQVSVFRPGRPAAARHLTPLPPGRWWRANPGLLLATDGTHLLTAGEDLPGRQHRPPPRPSSSQNPARSVLAPHTSAATRSPETGR